ncbi:histidine phosphatase family protein [Marivivens sp. LCG002]|uniref:histidine phosphatase family protein n=1 Tax=Marivivens sp. LCG002 TaxID=3051171 RepID=UPI002555CE8E|nr:histidine phosphatase family protein [Marivivens sp. LCG002]WIV50609.1 histidine phosphatase family protein [Marivivens sp. LCG002]
MGTITLIRHGQANSSADNEEEYDRLSDLGHRQSRWLGEWFETQSERFDLVLSGSLRRHKETAMGLGFDTPVIDPRLNEMDYFNLGRAMEINLGVPMPKSDGFAEHLPKVMEAWHRAEIQGNETFATFENRVVNVLQEAIQPGRHVLCITSGGVISMILRHLLELDPRKMAHIALPIFNTSIHRVHVSPVGPLLAGYNAVPHLEAADRAFALTHF